jgi:hypothetical protein
MDVPPGFKLCAGIVVFVVGLGIHLLDAFHRLSYLETDLPAVYSFVVSPIFTNGTILAGLFVMVVGIVELKKHRLHLQRENIGERKPTSKPLSDGVFDRLGSDSGDPPPATLQAKASPGPQASTGGMNAGIQTLVIRNPVVPPRELRASTAGNGAQRFEVGAKPTRLIFRPSQTTVEVKDLPKEMDFGTYNLTVACDGTSLVINDHNRQVFLDVLVEHAEVPGLPVPTIHPATTLDNATLADRRTPRRAPRDSAKYSYR